MEEREEKCIDFVLRAIETRLAKNRGNVWSPEAHSDTPENSRIDAAVKIGEKNFAIEHTMIEPYEGHHRQGKQTNTAEAEFLGVLGDVDLNIGVDIALPSNWMEALPKKRQRTKFLKSLASLFRYKLDEIKILPDDDKFFCIGEIDGSGINVVRNGLEELGNSDACLYFVLLADDYKNGRAGRIKRALDEKIPKLHKWETGHKTVLILENRDISLTNWRSVRGEIESNWVDISDIPLDYLYFVSAPHPTWRLYPFIEEREWVPPKPNGLVRVDRIDCSELSLLFGK